MSWALGKTVLFRTAIFVGMASVVTTIIYFSPVPGQEFVSCERECHDLEMPMICRVRIVLEMVEASAVGGCPANSTTPGCPSDGGNGRWVMAANRQLPGPSIHVCQHDILVVDVVNKMDGVSTAVHWRGQSVRETPFMDGVAMVTQCPVHAGATFQYKLRAADAGTHLWHARAPSALGGDGAFGALVVRQATARATHAALYDRDDAAHLAVIGACADGRAILVNGRREPSPESFELQPGQRHLLRWVNGVGLQQGGRCAVTVSLQGHEVLVVALDGHPVEPRRAKSVQLSAGESVDVVVTASSPRGGDFALRVDAESACAVLPGVAVVRYAATPTPTPAPTPMGDVTAPALSTRLDADACNGASACLSELRAHQPMPDELRTPEVDVNLFLDFRFSEVGVNASQTLSWAYRHRVPSTNNLTFVLPPSPLLTQPEDVQDERLCNRRRRPAHCVDVNAPCECVHVVDVALGASVELLLSDGGGGERQQVFHLHGHSFHVVGVRIPTPTSTPTLDEAEARRLDAQGTLLSRNLVDAVVKDTVTVPRGGVVALRFLADNPGYWLLENAESPGLNVVLHVGSEGDGPATPAKFPRCRGFVGPDFFLI